MCQELKSVNQFGYNEAIVNNETAYFWNQNCHSSEYSKSLKTMVRYNGSIGIVSGWALHMPIFLSKALNVSIRYVPAEFPQQDDTIESMELTNREEGDVFAVDVFWPSYNLFTGDIYDSASPVSEMIGGGILSLPKAKLMAGSDVVKVFDHEVRHSNTISRN